VLLISWSLILQNYNPLRHLNFSEKSWWKFESSEMLRRAVW